MTEAGAEGNARRAPSWRPGAFAFLVALALLGCGREPRATRDTMATSGATVSATVDSPPPVPADSVAATPAAVTAFLGHVEARRAPDSARASAATTAEGIRLLAAAIEAVAVRDTAVAAKVRPRLDVLRAQADSAQRDSLPAERARRAGEAFVLASELLQTLQEGTPPALTDRAAEARQAAAAVRSDQPLSEQTDAVRRFFDRAAAALRGMAGPGPQP